MWSFLVYVVYLLCLQSLINCRSLECTNSDPKQYPTVLLPRINLAKYTDGSIEEKEKIVLAFKEHLHQYGSISLYNHGISQSLIKNVEISGQNYFKQSDEYKSLYTSDGLGTPGYDPLLSLSASAAYGGSSDYGDFTEMYAMFNHISGTNTYDIYHPLEDETPYELYNVSRQYIPEIRRVLKIVHNMAADALFGINTNKTNYFENIYSETPHFQLRWLNYPNVDDIDDLIKSNRFAISEHKDYLGFTLLHPGKSRGLQNKIGGKNGVWIDCEIQDENDIFINTGELFDVWTNGYWKANWHRVILNNEERTTFSYFTGPNNDEMIQALEGCSVCTEEPAKYASRTAGQHAQLRFGGSDLLNSDGKKFFSD